MKHSSFVGSIALVTAFTALTGCAAQSGSPEDGATSSTSSAMQVTTVGPVGPVNPIVSFDPTVLCSPIAADTIVPLPAPHTEKITAGTADLSRSCDYWVTEVDDTAGQSFFISLGDLQPTSPNQAPNYQSRRWAATPSDCAASYVTYDVMAYTPEHIVPGPGPYGITIIPGAWSTIHTNSGNGTYYADNGGYCEILAATGPIYSQYGNAYSKVRVAAAEVIQTPSGPKSQTLFLYVGH